jgi:formylmethanofuran dehydrogenase subunit C
LFKIPIDAENITPDAFADKSIDEIEKLSIWEGNKKRALGEIFKIKGNANTLEEMKIHIIGDISKIRRIGTKMSAGEIIIDGNVGMHLGEEMRGGKITVTGDADSWVGCMLMEGTIIIQGNAGDFVGSAYRGASTKGMNGGIIIVEKSVGTCLGYFMRNGLIKVGNVGQFAGIHMKKGTILIEGNSEGRTGAQMTGGKIIICGYIPSCLPTFSIDDIRPSVKANGKKIDGPFYRFIGDLADKGKGRLFISKTNNPHLKIYDKYL